MAVKAIIPIRDTILQLKEEKMNNQNKNFKRDEKKIGKYEISESSAYDLASNSKIFPKKLTKEVHIQSVATNVHVNPNFKLQSPAMHINPKICTKPLIHVNPKMMHDIASSNQNLQNNVTCITKSNIDSRIMQTNIKRSIYVNPTLLKKLSTKEEALTKLKEKESYTTKQFAPSSTTSIGNINNRKISPKKACDSSVVLLSSRKLVRVAHTVHNVSETSSISRYKLQQSVDLTQRRSGTTLQRVTKVSPLVNSALRSTNLKSNLSKLVVSKSKMSKYKIDRTTLQVSKVKYSPPKTRKVVKDTVELVTIGGIVYKSSKNRLIRRSCSLKQKRSIHENNEKSVVSYSAKKLRRNKENLNHVLETSTINKTRLSSNILPKTTYKNNISNKVKQRSIQILRNKMRKNNQPCLIFQKFGYCLNHKKGVCAKQHDKKQVSICKKFLQGKCLLDKCPLSHDIGPQKMPTCKYFLDGCCTRDACPYLHVKVSSNTSICIDFLQGYCSKGNECQRRHEYLCPEFDKSGNCIKGKYCPYPHKSHPCAEESTKYISKKTLDVQKHQVATSIAKDDTDISNNPESRLRYYERSGNLSDNFERKEENILRKVEVTENNDLTVDFAKQMESNETINESLVEEDKDESVLKVKDNIKKRIPIGSLPAYIPID